MLAKLSTESPPVPQPISRIAESFDKLRSLEIFCIFFKVSELFMFFIILINKSLIKVINAHRFRFIKYPFWIIHYYSFLYFFITPTSAELDCRSDPLHVLVKFLFLIDLLLTEYSIWGSCTAGQVSIHR